MSQPHLSICLSVCPPCLSMCLSLSQSSVCPPGPVDPVLSGSRAPLHRQAGGKSPVHSTTTTTGGHCLWYLPLGGRYATAVSGSSRPSGPSTAFWNHWIRIRDGASGMGRATRAHCNTTPPCDVLATQPQTNKHCQCVCLFFLCVRCEMATAILTAGGEFVFCFTCVSCLFISACLHVYLSACLSAADYELQASLSEALCRLAPRKERRLRANQWFPCRDIGDAFCSIRDQDFEVVGVCLSVEPPLTYRSSPWTTVA